MVKVLYYRISEELEPAIFNHYLQKLPVEFQEKALRYRRWQDQYTNLFGKLLLVYGLKEFGFTANDLNKLKYNAYNKPFLENGAHFNLSHSGDIVICAISTEQEIGIDIEEMKPINIWEFDTIFTKNELEIMNRSTDPVYTFYKYWTIKESVIKAIGKGMALPLNEVVVSEDDHCSFRNQHFKIQIIDVEEGYYCALADSVKQDYSLNQIFLNDF